MINLIESNIIIPKKEMYADLPNTFLFYDQLIEIHCSLRERLDKKDESQSKLNAMIALLNQFAHHRSLWSFQYSKFDCMDMIFQLCNDENLHIKKSAMKALQTIKEVEVNIKSRVEELVMKIPPFRRRFLDPEQTEKLFKDIEKLVKEKEYSRAIEKIKETYQDCTLHRDAFERCGFKEYLRNLQEIVIKKNPQAKCAFSLVQHAGILFYLIERISSIQQKRNLVIELNKKEKTNQEVEKNQVSQEEEQEEEQVKEHEEEQVKEQEEEQVKEQEEEQVKEQEKEKDEKEDKNKTETGKRKRQEDEEQMKPAKKNKQ
jgi:hypothetical protein